MDKDCATIIISTASKAARDIGDIISIIDDEDSKIKLALAAIIYDIMENVISPIQDEHTSLKEEIEHRMDKYDRAF